jgi:hypothetical protein
VLAPEVPLLLRAFEHLNQKRRIDGRTGDEAATRRQAVNASSGEHAGAGQADATPPALAEMMLIPGGVRARLPRIGGSGGEASEDLLSGFAGPGIVPERSDSGFPHSEQAGRRGHALAPATAGGLAGGETRGLYGL